MILKIQSYISKILSIRQENNTRRKNDHARLFCYRAISRSSIVSLYNIPSNVKESIMNNNMKKMFDTDVFVSDDEYEGNNVPNYDIFNKHVFDIFQQVETIQFAYTIVVSKWTVLGHQYPLIDEYFIWQKKWFKDDYLENTIDDINEGNIFDSNKKKTKKS